MTLKKKKKQNKIEIIVAAYTKLILSVKKLEHKVKASKSRRRTKIVDSDDEEVSEDPSKQGRINTEIDQNPCYKLYEDKGKFINSRGYLRASQGRPSADIEDIEEIDIARQEQEKYDLAQALELQKQLDEREEVVAEADPAQVIDWSDPVVLRYHAQQNRSFSKAEVREVSESVEEQFAGKEKEVSEEELKKLLVIVPVEEVYIKALQDMLKRFDRDDLEKIWDLVKKKFSSTEPTVDKEKVLWVELKRLFEPDDDDTLWKLRRIMP
ncbi:hypothetical protein Tco_0775415 [Tanacetum coccineum]